MKPPRIPAMSPKIVSSGIMQIIAIIFGTTRKRIGSKPMVRSASISSDTFMVPISAAKAEPARPVAITATISGASSRTTVQPTNPGRNPSAPYLRICTAAW